MKKVEDKRPSRFVKQRNYSKETQAQKQAALEEQQAAQAAAAAQKRKKNK